MRCSSSDRRNKFIHHRPERDTSDVFGLKLKLNYDSDLYDTIACSLNKQRDNSMRSVAVNNVYANDDALLREGEGK